LVALYFTVHALTVYLHKCVLSILR